MGQGADAVPLNFEKPVGIGKRLIRKCGEHGTDARGHRAFAYGMEVRRLDGDWISFRWKLLRNFVDRSASENAAIVRVDFVSRIFGGILVLDEEPLVAFLAVLQLDEDETAAELFAIENEFQLAFF